MKILSNPIALLAIPSLCRTIGALPTKHSSTSILASTDSAILKDDILSSDSPYGTGYISNNSIEELEHTTRMFDNSIKKYELEEVPSNENLLEKSPEWQAYDQQYIHSNTTEATSTAPEVSSTDAPFEVSSTTSAKNTVTAGTSSTAAPLEVISTTPAETTITDETNSTPAPFEVSSTTPVANSTVSSTASSQEQTSNQGLWSYLSYSIGSLGFILGAAATTFIKNKFCSNGVQGESNEEMDTFTQSYFLTPVNNATLEFDNNVALMAEHTEGTQA